MDSADFARPIPKNTTEITSETNKAQSIKAQPDGRAAQAGHHQNSDFSDNITIEQIEGLFGAELLEDMIAFVTEYVDVYYPRYRHTNHPPVSRASKAAYAYRLLLCAIDLGLPPDDLKDCLLEALKKEKKYDPRLNLVTRPKALGIWLLDGGFADLPKIRESRYNWEGDTSEYELNPFSGECRMIYDILIPRWKERFSTNPHTKKEVHQ